MAKYASLDSLRAIRDWAKEKFQSKLPEISATDNGKVLSVVEGQWEPTELQEELPEVTSADNGKVLAVVAGEWEKAEAPDELPEVSASDNGKFLGVVNGAWGKAEVNALPAVTSQDNGKVLGVVEGQWAPAEPEDGLPEVTSSDNGKVLSVVEGAWEPAVPTGGSGLPEVTSEDNGDILSVVDGAWAKSEPGYRVSTEEVQIAAEQSVTTAAQGPYIFGQITATVPDPLPDSINVTFNGTSYENVPKHTEASLGGIDIYGDMAFTEYPFAITFVGGNLLLTQTAGTYTIAITGQTTSITPNDDFKAAVKASGAGQAPLEVTLTYDSTGMWKADKTFGAIMSEYLKGRQILVTVAGAGSNIPELPQMMPAYQNMLTVEAGGQLTLVASLVWLDSGIVHSVTATAWDGDASTTWNGGYSRT